LSSKICAVYTLWSAQLHISRLKNYSMGLEQLRMAPLVSDDSLLRLFATLEKFSRCNTRHFSSGIRSTIRRYVYFWYSL